jgi:hypothetical protein
VTTSTLPLAACVIAAALATPAGGQPAPDSAGVEAFRLTTRAARDHLARDAGRLWGARLDTIPWMGVAGARAYLTADPARAGYAAADAALFAGPLPASIAPANTAVTWAARRWAMVLLPLPADTAAATRLLIHEAAHVAQPAAIPAPPNSEGGATGEWLDGPEGRLWLQLELRALAAALAARGPASARAVDDALGVRARRDAAAGAAERRRERALESTEGLPEYTAWALTTAAPDGAFARWLERAPRPESYVRASAYLTGPAYALLLDRTGAAPSWRASLDSAPDLPALLLRRAGAQPAVVRAALAGGRGGGPGAVAALERAAEGAAARYAGAALRRTETARWEARSRAIAALRARFVAGPTLRLRPPSLRITFDPRGQSALGESGSVMANVAWVGDAGAALEAPGGALVTPAWDELRVPLGAARLRPGVLAAATEWRGEGWRLRLPAGWRIEPAGRSWVATPPRTRGAR